MKFLLLALLASPSFSVEVPYHLRQMNDARDVDAINQNFRALSDSIRENESAAGDVTAAGNNTFTGDNAFNSSTTFNGGVFGLVFQSSVSAPQYTQQDFANAGLSGCVAGSSLTIVTNGGTSAWVNAQLYAYQTTTLLKSLYWLHNGALEAPYSPGAPHCNEGLAGEQLTWYQCSYLFQNLSSGSHTFCLAPTSSASLFRIVYTGTTGPAQYWVKELP